MTPISGNTAIDDRQPIPVDYLLEPYLEERGIRLGILRLDSIHPDISGNKWFKLKENIRLALENGYDTLLTFGGAYSNHLAATAAAAAGAGLKAIALVRGWHGSVSLSPTLDFCVQQGMQLHFVSREEYNLKYDPAYLEKLGATFGQPYIIPEGGNNEAGRKGCEQIAAHIPPDAGHVALAIGTGTTFCGIRNGLDPATALHGVPVMKNGGYLAAEIREHLEQPAGSWRLYTEYHFGGFARHTPQLVDFMNGFYRRHAIRLDFVYTAKQVFAVSDMIRKGSFEDNAHIICVHTGGLQGNSSLKDQLCF